MSSFDQLQRLLESFESYLGNPEHDDTLINFQQSLAFDEQEALALPHIEYIQQWGYMDYLIPRSLGGTLDSLTELYFFTKSLARRDITTAIALGLSFFGALPIWISGNDEQKNQLSTSLRQGKISALALTEEEHGSDLTANEMRAVPHKKGWELSGRKWCINFATKGQFVTIICRTHEQGGVLGFSLFFIDKSKINIGLTATPKLPTHGVRGLDISGVSLDKVLLPTEALIGKEQRGLEIIYKALQVSRTLCGSLAVGGADTALRLALTFSVQRELYGKAAFAIPVVKQRLAEQFVLLLTADCMSLMICRACTVIPEKMSFWSAIIKFLVPEIAEHIVEQCALVLGARGYLRTNSWAMFQKIRRDLQVIGLFDGSSQVNLSLIAGNLVPQASKRGTDSNTNAAKLEHIFNMKKECLSFTGSGLGLFTHEEDDVLATILRLDYEPINSLIGQIRQEIVALDQCVLKLHAQKLFDPRSLAAFRLAERFCWIFATSCCVLYWYYNQEWLPPELKDTAWLRLAIQLMLIKIHGDQPIEMGLHEKMAEYLYAYFRDNKMFSVVPITLASH